MAVRYFSEDQKARWPWIRNCSADAVLGWGWGRGVDLGGGFRGGGWSESISTASNCSSLWEGFLRPPAPISTMGVGAGNAGQWASLLENFSQVGCWVNHQAACSRVGLPRCRCYTVSQSPPEGLSTSCPHGNLPDNAYSAGFLILPVLSSPLLISCITWYN